MKGDDCWIIDSGASQHMTSNHDLLIKSFWSQNQLFSGMVDLCMLLGQVKYALLCFLFLKRKMNEN